MKVHRPLLSLLWLPLLVLGADDPSPRAARIIGEAFVRNGAIVSLKTLADDIGPRLTGSDAAHRAALYCSGLFKSYGLDPVQTETFEIVGWLPGPAAAEALAPVRKALRVDTLGFSVSTPPEGLTAELIDVGHGTEEDFERAGARLAGKIALAGLETPANAALATREWQKVDYAAKHGAAGCLIIASTRGGLTRTRASKYGGYSDIPAASIAYEDGTWLRRTMKTAPSIRVNLRLPNTIKEPQKAENVVAEIRGSERPDELVVVGAHLDSWFLGPGAADNALGVSIALETARILSDPRLRPRRTVRFVLFSGEEEGLLGSFHHVQSREREWDRMTLMINMDMTGLMYPGFLNPYGACPIDERLAGVLPVLAGLGVTGVERRHPYDSDDFNFIARGIPALGLQGRGARDWAWGHSYADTFEKIEIDKLNMSVAAIAAIVDYAANAAEPVGRRASQDEVVKFFKDRGLDKILKQEGTWTKLGFPDAD